MHHLLLFVLAGFILSRLILRARLRRAWSGGGRCCRAHRFAPIDLGAPDAPPPWSFRRRHRFAQRRPVDLTDALALNQRQRELYDDVLARAKPSLSPAALTQALALVGREPFDREALASIAPADLVDDLEHLHHSLTPEQRATLRGV